MGGKGAVGRGRWEDGRERGSRRRNVHLALTLSRRSVSPEQQQVPQQQGVFERIEADKLSKALESSQLMAKLEVG